MIPCSVTVAEKSVDSVSACLWVRAQMSLHTKKTNNQDHAMDGEGEESREIPLRAKWRTGTGHDSFVQPLP